MTSKIASAHIFLALCAALTMGSGQAGEKSPGTPKAAETIAPTNNAPTPASSAVKSYDGPYGLAMGISGAELMGSLGFKADGGNSVSYEGTPPSELTHVVIHKSAESFRNARNVSAAVMT